MTNAAGPLLVLRLSALGDILHTLPAVEALRAAFPSREIGWLVERPYRDLVQHVAPVDHVFTVATRQWRRQPLRRQTRAEIAESFRSLRRFARDGTSIDFQGLNKSALLGVISGARERYGFARVAIREKSATLFTNRRVVVDQSRHVVEWNLELAAAVGAAPLTDRTSRIGTFPQEDEKGVLRNLVKQHPIILNPGAGQPSKLWPVERFAELSRRIAALGAPPLLVWGPGERDLAAAIARGGVAEVAPETNLRQLAFLLGSARLVVAADTGPLHLAAALGTPVVALFGPTNPMRNGPWGQPGSWVESYTSDRSMRSIQVDAVAQKVEEIVR